jgi:tetratricopeptide (TPR) repeat protein
MVDERENIRPPEKSLTPGGKPDPKPVASVPPQKDIPIGFGVITPEMERYRTMIAKDPTSRVFAALAELYRKAGMLDEAVRLCLNGIKAHPKYMSGRVALARAYFDKGLIKEAKEEVLSVVSVTPDNIVANKILGDIHLLEDDAVNARERFLKVLSLSPDDAEAKEKLKQSEQIAPAVPSSAAPPAEAEEILDGEALEVVDEAEPSADTAQAVPPEGGEVTASTDEAESAVIDEVPAEGAENMDDSDELDIPLGDDLSLDDLLIDESADAGGVSPGPEESEEITDTAAAEPGAEDELWEVEDDAGASVSDEAREISESEAGSGVGDAGIDLEEDQDLVDEFGILEEREGEVTVEGLDNGPKRSRGVSGGDAREKVAGQPDARAPERPTLMMEETSKGKSEGADAQSITITTETIADIYVKQGYFDRALSVYEDLLGVYPTRDSLKQKISFVKNKIREMSGAEPKETAPIETEDRAEALEFAESVDEEKLQKNIESLNRWLLTIRKFRRI